MQELNDNILLIMLVVGYVFVVIVHELGHYLQSRALGTKPSFGFDGWSLNVNFDYKDYFWLTPPMFLLICLQGMLLGALALSVVIYFTGLTWLWWLYLLMCSQDMQSSFKMLTMWRKWGTPVGYTYLKLAEEQKQKLEEGLVQQQCNS